MADMNDLQRDWDSLPEYSEEKMNEIAELVRTRSGSMRSVLFARDMGEAIAGIFIMIVFGAYWFWIPTMIGDSELAITVARTGAVITIVGAVEIIFVTQFVQRRGRVDFASVPLKKFLQTEVQMLNREIALLRQVLWWYILPLYVGACVFVIGISLDDGWETGWVFAVPFCTGYFVFCAYLWWLNQKARKKTLEPLRDALQQTYDGLVSMEAESGGPPGDLAEVLKDSALDMKCRRSFRLVRPSWHHVVVIAFAGLGGLLVGMQIQSWLGQPRRYEEWPLLGLMVAALIAVSSACVRRIRDEVPESDRTA